MRVYIFYKDFFHLFLFILSPVHEDVVARRRLASRKSSERNKFKRRYCVRLGLLPFNELPLEMDMCAVHMIELAFARGNQTKTI